MTPQTKEQQAVALVEKHGINVQYITDRVTRLDMCMTQGSVSMKRIAAMLSDHAQQVREAHTQELVANAVGMPNVYEAGNLLPDVDVCFSAKVRKAIAAMQAQNDSLVKTLEQESAARAQVSGMRDELRAQLDRAQSLNEMSLETIRALQDTNLALLGHVEQSRARVAELEAKLDTAESSAAWWGKAAAASEARVAALERDAARWQMVEKAANEMKTSRYNTLVWLLALSEGEDAEEEMENDNFRFNLGQRIDAATKKGGGV